jgi:hypothetical protein
MAIVVIIIIIIIIGFAGLVPWLFLSSQRSIFVNPHF